MTDPFEPPSRNFPVSIRLPVQRRLLVLAACALASAALFLRMLASGTQQPVRELAGFAVVVATIATLIAWPGLRCADRVGLPMPYLRRLDGGPPLSLSKNTIAVSLAAGAGLGLASAVALRLADAPQFPGTVVARALSTACVAVPLEMVLHLGVMSIVVWMTGGRRWPGIVIALLALVALQSTGGALDHAPAVVVISTIANAATGLMLGWIYATYGFECVVLARAGTYLVVVLAV
jgi:hypothetical protein